MPNPHKINKSEDPVIKKILDYLAKVVTGIKFKDGVEVTKVDQAVA